MKKKRLTKKGISPLIATVLLIGFTVAIIALIIIWSRGYVVEKAEKEGALAKAQLECQKTDWTITDASASGDKLVLNIKNKGTISLDGFLARITDDDGEVAVVEAADKVEGMQMRAVTFENPAIADALAKGPIEKVFVAFQKRAGKGAYVPCPSQGLTIIGDKIKY